MTVGTSNVAVALDQVAEVRGGKTTEKPRLGVAVLVIDAQGRLLLGRRGKQPNYGKWVIPGGGVEFGESWRETGEREINEETGLDVVIDQSERPLVLEVLGDNEHRVILYAQARLIGGVLRPSSDLLDAGFFTRDGLPISELSPIVVPVLREFGWIARGPLRNHR
jgi:ADP-ribose pyrophosphatase YjhB (NUDIX family)